mmetsp:Transcript_16610/g.39458  ORF Transcript_16610/g.39458 Transcript_16610/m.39458 type:complete len:219 (-) Transcript_16610:245-901(-)
MAKASERSSSKPANTPAMQPFCFPNDCLLTTFLISSTSSGFTFEVSSSCPRCPSLSLGTTLSGLQSSSSLCDQGSVVLVSWSPYCPRSSLALKSSRSSARGWCMLQISRRPPSASCAKTRPSIKAQLASRPVVGSSSTMIGGDTTNSTPIATRRRSPPEMPRLWLSPIFESATSSNFNIFRAQETRPARLAALSDRSRNAAENSRASLTVSVAPRISS